jgi:hypothetical protein
MAHGQRAVLVHGGPRIGPRRWLNRARPSGCSGPRRLAARVTTGRGQRGATGAPLNGAWTVVRRWHTRGGASAPSDNGMGVREEGRR